MRPSVPPPAACRSLPTEPAEAEPIPTETLHTRPMTDESHAWRVPTAAEGERLDRHVADHLGEARNQVQRWMDEDRVLLEGAPAKASARVAAGDRVEVSVPPPPDPRIEPEEGELGLLHTDRHLIVLDKPPELVVHPGAGHPTGTLAHRLLAHFPEIRGIGGPGRPGIVHRLDKDTSGVMVVARTAAAYRKLSRAFASRDVSKRYLAIVYGRPDPASGTIDAPVGRHPQRRKEMTVRPRGRRAVTHYRTLASARGLSLLELDLETGRTHQIRVHLKHLGHPLVGDPVYGEARWKARPKREQPRLRDFPRPALHAWRISFEHPEDGRRIRFGAPVPEDLLELWEGASGEGWPEVTSSEQEL